MLEGHIYTDGPITKEYPANLKEQIASLDPGVTQITHHISSPGGDCYAAYQGYHELLKTGKPIDAIIEGEAQSMATFLALASRKVTIMNPSTWMIHEPFFPEGAGGTIDDLESSKTELVQIRDAMARAYAEKTKKPVEEIMALMKKTTRLDAVGAKNMGFVDEVRTPVRALGAEMIINEFKNLEEKVMNLFKKRAAAAGPTALDLPLKDGKVLVVDTENGDLISKSATIDGVAANGTYDLADGRQIVVTGGVVAEVKTAAVPQETAEQKLQKQMQAIQDQLASMKAAEQAKINAEEAAKILAEQNKKAEEAAAALEAKTKEAEALAAKVAELESKPAGSTAKPAEGMNTHNTPAGAGPQASEGTMIFLEEQMGWLKDTQDIKGQKSALAHFKRSPSAVSILETNFNYTYPGLLTTEIFYKPTLQAPALSDVFTIDQGIKFQKQYNLVTQLDKILRPYTGCERTFNGNRQLITNTTVVTKEFQVAESWCKDDFTGYLSGRYNILAQEWLKTGNRSFDPSGTPINQIIDRILMDALQRDVARRVYFGAGNSSDADYNQIDGLWDRLIDSSGGSNYCVVRAGSALGTGTLATNAALTALEAVYANSSIILKNAPGKKFFVTRSIWDNYYNSLIANGAVTQVTEASFENIQKGLQTLTYKGIPVIPVDVWDGFLAESDNPLFATTRHLILLTVKENHILGVENSADLNKIEGWYERKDRKFYYEADMKFGYNYLHCDLQTIAY